MFWIDPLHQRRIAMAGLDYYEAAADLHPTDDYVQKQGRSTGRYRIEIHGETLSLYVKKHFRLSWWLRRFAPLWMFPGPHEWRNLKIAASLGVRVPEAVFAGAERENPCGSVLGVRELVGYLPLHIYVPGPLARMPEPERSRRKRALIARLADTARRLHGRRYYHRDFYLCHFFLRDDPAATDGFDLVLIDFGRLLHSRLGRWQIKDLAALLFSTDIAGVSPKDRLRFFKQYLGVKKLDADGRALLRRVTAKADRYRRHNAGPRAA
jgi:heptose I phosphotransferase